MLQATPMNDNDIDINCGLGLLRKKLFNKRKFNERTKAGLVRSLNFVQTS